MLQFVDIFGNYRTDRSVHDWFGPGADKKEKESTEGNKTEKQRKMSEAKRETV